MAFKNTLLSLSIAAFMFSLTNVAFAQDTADSTSITPKEKHRTGSIYGSWGYNEESYTHSNIHILQNGLGNNYEFVQVGGHDHQGWNNGVLNKALTIPQYNYRIGYYFNKNQDLGIEGNFDHTKYIIVDGTTLHMKGTFNHRSVDSTVVFSQANGDYYYLNNGANFLLFNIVKRLGLYHTHDNYFRLDLVGKAGIGPVIPHVQNSLFGNANDPHFQFGGWNTGAELVLRATFLRYAYLEFSQKIDYARYSNLKLYDGTAKQNFGTYETILSFGVIIPTTKHNHMFQAPKDAPEIK